MEFFDELKYHQFLRKNEIKGLKLAVLCSQSHMLIDQFKSQVPSPRTKNPIFRGVFEHMNLLASNNWHTVNYMVFLFLSSHPRIPRE